MNVKDSNKNSPPDTIEVSCNNNTSDITPTPFQPLNANQQNLSRHHLFHINADSETPASKDKRKINFMTASSNSSITVPVTRSTSIQVGDHQSSTYNGNESFLPVRQNSSYSNISLTNIEERELQGYTGEVYPVQGPFHPPSGYNRNSSIRNQSEVKSEKEKCTVSARVLMTTNIILTLFLVGIICIVPLEAMTRTAINAGLDNMLEFSGDIISKFTRANLAALEDAVNTIAISLQINQTKQLRPWGKEDMPTMMQQLCNIFSSSPDSEHILFLQVSSPYSGFGAYCTKQYDGKTLVGKYITDGSSDFRYIVDPKTFLYAEPREPFTRVKSMTEKEFTVDFSTPDNPFVNIAIPWRDQNEGRRWWVFSSFNQSMVTYTYPFIDYLGNLAVITGALQTSKLQDFFPNEILKNNITSSMVIELQTGLVLNSIPGDKDSIIWDNLNCSAIDGPCGTNYHDTTDQIETTKNNYLRAAAKKLGGRDGIAMLLRKVDYSQTTFKYKGRTLVASVSRVYVPDDHLVFAVIGLMEKSSVTGTLESNRNRVLLGIVIGVVFIGILELIFVYIFVKPFRVMSRGLSLMMQLRDGSRLLNKISSVREVAIVQHQFQVLNQQLMYMKKFLPHETVEESNVISDKALLEWSPKEITEEDSIPLQTEREERERNDIVETKTAKIISEEKIKVSSSSAVHTGICTECSESLTKIEETSPEFNDSLTKDSLNQFRRRHCTIVCIGVAILESDYSIDSLTQEFMGTSIPLVTRYGGIIEVQRPYLLIVSFGAHSKMARHQTQGVHFALELLQLFRSDFVDRLAVIVDSGEYLVGTCGVLNQTTRTSYSPQIGVQTELLRLVRSLNSHVLITLPVVISINEQFVTIPVDVFACGVSGKPIVLYELRAHTSSLESERIQELNGIVRSIRHGFANMLRGKYTEAVRFFAMVEGKDVQADRLLKMCRRIIRKGITKPYIRSAIKMRTAHLSTKSNNNNINSSNTDTSITNFTPATAAIASAAAAAAAASGKETMISMLNFKHNFSREGLDQEETLPSGLSACAATFLKRNALTDNRGEITGDDECDGALFEMFLESSDEDDDANVSLIYPAQSHKTAGSMAPTIRGNMKGEIPFVFNDYEGNTWTRSVDKIGTGAFSVVYRGMSSSGELVALKSFALRARNIDIADVVEELRLFSQFRHENIVQYISCYFSSDYLIEVMELVPGGSLDNVLISFGSLSTVAVRRFLRDALHGLMYLHSKNVVHCDVKPHNVLVALDGVCKLSDFGSSLLRLTNSFHEISDVFEMRGTPGYMAPEVARGEVPTAKSDVFSLGVTVLELFMGRLPWNYVTETEAVTLTESATVTSNNNNNNNSSTNNNNNSHSHYDSINYNNSNERNEKNENKEIKGEAVTMHVDSTLIINDENEIEKENVVIPANAIPTTAIPILQIKTEEEELEEEPQSFIPTQIHSKDQPLKSPTWFPHQEVYWHQTEIGDSRDWSCNIAKNDIESLLRSPTQLLISVGKGEVRPTIPLWLDDEVRDFIQLCISPNPEQRPTVKELLQHPWMV